MYYNITQRGLKPIHLASQYGSLEVLQLLIRVGCSPTTIAENEVSIVTIYCQTKINM